MAKIIIDGQEVECRDKISVLQAALEAGWDVPHYCYHPALSVVASCRLCLMEMKVPHPKTKELVWAPKLEPSCQTPVRDGMEVRFDSAKVKENQKRCMEFLLLNHPLDCPVCDQAGECLLQDYSERFGEATSRMVEAKHKNPKKDIGSKTLLYVDRCITCTRCVRFCDEIAGTGELCVVSRGSRAEIDVFAGVPLENALQGNVVDICPVGSLLDKDFLMKQRVWFLEGTASICPGCSAGCAIRIDHNDGRVWRLKPRYNPGVNDWWMCDEGRFGWKTVHDPKRLNRLIVRRGQEGQTLDWSELPELARVRFEQVVNRDGAAKVGALLSPFMSCEEAWLLARFIRGVAPAATLAMGPVPVEGEDETFPKRRNVETSKRRDVDREGLREDSRPGESRIHRRDAGATGDGEAVKFTIRAEKCPNRRGVEMVLAGMGGHVATFEEFAEKAGEGAFSAAWIVGGYPAEWVTKDFAKAIERIGVVFAQDLYANAVTDTAVVTVPGCTWAERSGCFVNCDGKIQPFEAAVAPPAGCQRDGHYMYALTGEAGLYNAAKVRETMAEEMPEFGALHVPPAVPKHAH
ncbi:MAG: (2Fe-2S)-binding protein [Phycisphaerae bacterium]|nr:(2Fe-2S)-binding protein [Phycisphaerae bacterium]